MLVVESASCMLPAFDSLVVFTTSTLLLEESKASKIDRSGDISMRPGEPPALIPPRARVSIWPSMIINPANAVGLEALWEAKTRSVSLLGGRVICTPALQETKPKLAPISTAYNRADFFKRQAPNYRKTRDLSAK